MKIKLILFPLALLALSACGGGGSGSNNVAATPMDQNMYLIDDAGMGCDEHRYDKIEDYCRALADEDLNRYCGHRHRRKLFDRDCRDYDWAVNDDDDPHHRHRERDDD